MKVQNANLSPLSGTDGAGRKQARRASSDPAGDDIHLSELVRSLRSMAADSPERQERLEQIARAFASGTYQVDAEATAARIIDDSLQYP
jgi:flagellar biosynthesis anti-sigma factor FlgM